jgi:hypothetical protein
MSAEALRDPPGPLACGIHGETRALLLSGIRFQGNKVNASACLGRTADSVLFLRSSRPQPSRVTSFRVVSS